MNIWEECTKVPITDLLTFIVDNRGKTVPTSESGHILIATNCIKNDSLYPKYEKVRYLSQETYDTFFRAHPLPGDIIFVCKGTPGRVCLVPDPIDFCIAQDMIALRVDRSKVDNHYLLAVLRSEIIQKHIYNTSVGDVIPHFKKQFMDTIEVPLPPLEYQKRIGDLYFNLSNKIELNNKMNAQLEEMAQALFKSWFVDFEPFKDGKFVESELGMIPEGWRVGKFTEIMDLCPGGTPKTSVEEFWENGDIPFFSPKDVTGSYCFDTEKHITSKGLDNCSSRLYQKNTVFITCRGTVGKVTLTAVPMAMNQSNYAILAKKGYSQFYSFFLTKSIVEKLQKKANGAVFSAITTKDFDEEIVIPPIEELVRFNIVAKQIFEKILCIGFESSHLSQLRDTLLPKLMNGEIEL